MSAAAIASPFGDASRPRRILILKPCCLGDVVQTTALIAAAAERWPAAAIVVGAGRWLHPLVASHPAVDSVIDVGGAGVRGQQRPVETMRLAVRLRRARFDLALVPDRAPLLSLLTRLAGVPVRAGLDSGGRGRWYNVRVPPLPVAHELDQTARLAAALGMAALPLPRVYPSADGVTEAETLWDQLGAPARLAVLAPGGGENPGARMTEKRWSAAGFAALASRLTAADLTVALVGGASDRAVAIEVQGHAPGARDLVGRTSLDTLMALLGRTAVFVGNDSGVSHLAAACNCPTIAIFGPTAPERYAPRGRFVRVVAPPAALRSGGDGSVRRPYTYRSAWQDAVSMADVWSAVQLALAGPDGGR